MRLWQDTHGLAIELDVPATPDGAGLRAMVASAGGINDMSIGLIIKKSTIFFDDDGLECHDVRVADVDHVTICDAGAFAGACCWLANQPSARMPPKIATASLRWRLGRLDRDQKEAEDRVMRERYLAAKAPVRRRPAGRGRPQKILIDGMQPMVFARKTGIYF